MITLTDKHTHTTCCCCTLCHSPCDLKDPKESYTAENRDAQRRHDGQFYQDSLYDASTHHEAVKAVKQGHKVGLQAQAVHLYKHLQGEHGQENFVGYVC